MSPASSIRRAKKDATWEFVVKMALIARDLMNGNPRLKEMGFHEESEGHNALAGGFQGQRQWTDHFPNGDFMEAILCSSFDWNGIRQPYVVATENDSLNGATMLLGHLLTGTAQMFSDVRTYWSPEAVKRVTGHVLSGTAENGIIHLINSGASAQDWSGQQTVDGKRASSASRRSPRPRRRRASTTRAGARAVWATSAAAVFPSEFLSADGMPCTMSRMNMVAGPRPGAADQPKAGRWTCPRKWDRRLQPHRPDLADHLVCATPDRLRAVRDCVQRDEQLGRQPWGNLLRAMSART